jgi:hypothetical protein
VAPSGSQLAAQPSHEESGPFAALRPEVELVGLAAQRPQAGAGGAGGRDPILQAEGEVGDAGAVVDRQHIDARHRRAGLGAHHVQRALVRMLEDVGAGLGDHDRQAPGLDFVEAQLIGQLLACAPGRGDVTGVIDGKDELR